MVTTWQLEHLHQSPKKKHLGAQRHLQKQHILSYHSLKVFLSSLLQVPDIHLSLFSSSESLLHLWRVDWEPLKAGPVPWGVTLRWAPLEPRSNNLPLRSPSARLGLFAKQRVAFLGERPFEALRKAETIMRPWDRWSSQERGFTAPGPFFSASRIWAVDCQWRPAPPSGANSRSGSTPLPKGPETPPAQARQPDRVASQVAVKSHPKSCRDIYPFKVASKEGLLKLSFKLLYHVPVFGAVKWAVPFSTVRVQVHSLVQFKMLSKPPDLLCSRTILWNNA